MKKGIYLTGVHLSACLLFTWAPLGGGKGGITPEAEHPCLICIQRLPCHHMVLVVLRELGMAALSLCLHHPLWRNCLNSSPRGALPCSRALSLACPAAGDPWCCARTAAPTALAVVLISVLAPSVQLRALPAGGKWVTLHENLLDKLVLVLLGCPSCTGR